MKKINKRVLSLIAASAAFVASASAEELISNYLVYDVNETEATLTGWYPDFDNPDLDIVVPATVTYNGNEVPVTAIAKECFYGMGITSVQLGKNVRQIGESAFMYCGNLSELELNEGLTEIGMQSFANCTMLQTLRFPSTLETIGHLAFWNATGLSGDIVIPASVKSIGVGVWRSDTAIVGIEVEKENAYYQSQDGVLFTKDMETLMCYPAGRSANSYTLPSTVKVIADQSMRNNPYLTSVKLNEGLETIGEVALASSALQSVNIPSTVKKIGSAAFFYGLKLKEFTVESGNQWFRVNDGMLIENANERIVASAPKSGLLRIPEGIKEIGDYAFYMNDITGVSLPSTVTLTGKAAFANCLSLKKVVLNEGLEEIGEMCFQDSSLLSDINFPSTLKKMRMQAFCSCTGLTSAMLPEGLEELENSIFLFCSGLKEAYVPGTLKTCGLSVFGNCENLSKVVIAEGVPEVYESMFNMCYALADITLPSTIEVLRPYCLYGCPFSKLELPEKLRLIEEAALYGTGLEEIVIPDNVESIGAYGLAWNFAATSIKLGKGVKEIGKNCIHFTYNLTSVELNEGLETIGEAGVSACYGLTELTIPSTVKNIGDIAFYNNPLETLINKAVEPQVIDGTLSYITDEVNIYENCTLYVPEESIEAYKSAAVWQDFNLIQAIGTGVKEMPAEATDLTIVGVYTLDGQRVENPSTGIYIYRMSDGSVRKVIR